MASDSLSAVLLAGFVGLLFLGYFNPGFPYSSFAILPLFGSLALLFAMNRRAALRERVRTSDAPPPVTGSA